jgi:hypothetical protein
MKPIVQAVTSLSLSIIASMLATWMLRRLIFRAEQPGTERPGEGGSPFAVVVVPIVIGNHITGPTIHPGRGKLPRLRGSRSKHR